MAYVIKKEMRFTHLLFNVKDRVKGHQSIESPRKKVRAEWLDKREFSGVLSASVFCIVHLFGSEIPSQSSRAFESEKKQPDAVKIADAA